jgi:hypothetical protein
MKADYGKRFGMATNIYDCEYRSICLARSEINMAYRNAERMKDNTLVFYDPQDGQYINFNLIKEHSHGMNVSIMQVDKLLMGIQFVNQLLRRI